MGAGATSQLEYDYNWDNGRGFNNGGRTNKAAMNQAKDLGFKRIAVLKLATWSRESHGLFDYENK